MFFFRKIWHALFSWNTRFQIRPFTLLLTICKQFITFWMTVVIFWAQLNKQNNEHFFRFYNLKNWHWRKVTPNKKILEIIREVWVIKKAKLRESFLGTCNLLPANHFFDNMIAFESWHYPIWMVESIFFRKQLKICFSRYISRGLWLCLPLEQKCYNEIDIWDKVFKNGLSKFCGRQPLKSLFSPLLNTLSHYFRQNFHQRCLTDS